MTEKRENSLAIYVHFGFCLGKCPYCDFVSEKLPVDLDFKAWLSEYKKALDFYIPFTKRSRISSIYFGGGTPSLLPDWFIAELISYIQSNYGLKPDAEITMEGNPSSVTLAKLKAWKSAGINRFSMGVQAFDDDVLRFLGRLHNGKEAQIALENVAKVFDNYSFDMIYAYPAHTAKDWQRQLAFSLSFGASHISLYQLVIEGPSLFYRQKLKPIADDVAAGLYEITDEMTEKAGIPWYEISNYAQKGRESRHNLTYWHYGEYIGIGPSAHGRVIKDGVRYASVQVKKPFDWFKAKNKNAEWTVITLDEQREEKILMGLRLREGLDVKLFDKDKICGYVKNGLLMVTDGKVSPTLKGRLVLDGIIEDMV